MTIDKKASAYAGTQDSDAYAGFVDGAEWQRRYWEEMLGTMHTICFGAIALRIT